MEGVEMALVEVQKAETGEVVAIIEYEAINPLPQKAPGFKFKRGAVPQHVALEIANYLQGGLLEGRADGQYNWRKK
jgi:hypothetical protein